MIYSVWREISWFLFLVGKSCSEVNGAKELKTQGVKYQGPASSYPVKQEQVPISLPVGSLCI